MIRFTIPLHPTAKGRPRVGRIGNHARMFTPAATERAEQEFVALAAPFAPATPLDAPLRVTLTFTMRSPAMPRWKALARDLGLVHPEGRPDVDNLAKLVLDALNRSGRFWRDDSRVVELRAVKRYGDQVGTEVVIEVMDYCDSAKALAARPGRVA